jgi:mRNA interferase RelE/StbE
VPSPYVVVYREEVLEEDLPGIPADLRARILRAIEQRLLTEPARYGQRLRRSLRGLWKLRVGDYRVCYEIKGRTVTVWAVLHRRDVYKTVAGRQR